ncbi:hypothetical protein Tco_0355623 [Tanacetum coccineum]
MIPSTPITAIRSIVTRTGEYILYMRMRQYISHTNHNLWDVIVNEDLEEEPAPTSGETSTPPAPKTTKQLAAKRNQERVKSILLLAIPNEYLLKFHNVPDAKSLWAAIKSRFGGNEESKKMQKNVLKHQFENFTTASNESLDKAYDRFYDRMNEKVFKFTSYSQIWLFLSSKNTKSTNELESASRDIRVSTARGTSQVSLLYGTLLENADQERNQGETYGDNGRSNAPTNESSSQALVAQDGLDEYAIRNKIIESQTTELNTKTSETVGKSNDANTKKPKSASKSVVSNPKINRDRVIIEDWNSDDEKTRDLVIGSCSVDSDELKFNLFSVSQMCDKKNSVLFTESECLILSPSFKLLDESHVVLRAPRKDDVYGLDLKNIVPSGDLDDFVDVDDTLDYMETEDDQDKGRTSSVVLEEKKSVDKEVSTKAPDILSSQMKVLITMIRINRRKRKGVRLGNAEDTERPRPTSTRSVLTLKPLPKIDPKDKGKKMIDEEGESDTESDDITEAEKKFKMLAKDEEVARKVQEEWEAKEEKKRLAKEEATKVSLTNEYDFIHARINVDKILVEELQKEEREKFTIEQRAKFLHDTIAAQRKFLAQQRLKRQDQNFVAIGSAKDDRHIKDLNKDPKKKSVIKETSREEDTAKVPAEQEVTEQDGKKRKSGHVKMLSRKRPRPQLDDVRMTKVIKGEFEKIKDIKVEDDSLACDSPLEVFTYEVIRLSKMDDDLCIPNLVPKGEYDIWSMRMRQYICYTDHNLWDVIVNGDLEEEPAPTGETSAPPAPKTAKQLAAKRNQERIKSILI